MKKWIAVFVVGGTLSTLGLGGTDSTAELARANDSGTDPCPQCCPPEICGYNGPSFDGTLEPIASR